MEYHDEGEDCPTAIAEVEGVLLQPDGGWIVPGRVYRCIFPDEDPAAQPVVRPKGIVFPFRKNSHVVKHVKAYRQYTSNANRVVNG